MKIPSFKEMLVNIRLTDKKAIIEFKNTTCELVGVNISILTAKKIAKSIYKEMKVDAKDRNNSTCYHYQRAIQFFGLDIDL